MDRILGLCSQVTVCPLLPQGIWHHVRPAIASEDAGISIVSPNRLAAYLEHSLGINGMLRASLPSRAICVKRRIGRIYS